MDSAVKPQNDHMLIFNCTLTLGQCGKFRAILSVPGSYEDCGFIFFHIVHKTFIGSLGD
jgi:hypothetical protein